MTLFSAAQQNRSVITVHICRNRSTMRLQPAWLLVDKLRACSFVLDSHGSKPHKLSMQLCLRSIPATAAQGFISPTRVGSVALKQSLCGAFAHVDRQLAGGGQQHQEPVPTPGVLAQAIYGLWGAWHLEDLLGCPVAFVLLIDVELKYSTSCCTQQQRTAGTSEADQCGPQSGSSSLHRLM